MCLSICLLRQCLIITCYDLLLSIASIVTVVEFSDNSDTNVLVTAAESVSRSIGDHSEKSTDFTRWQGLSISVFDQIYNVDKDS